MIFKIMVVAAAFLGYFYLFGSFVQGSLDPHSWSQDARFIVAMFGTAAASFSPMIVFALIKDSK